MKLKPIGFFAEYTGGAEKRIRIKTVNLLEIEAMLRTRRYVRFVLGFVCEWSPSRNIPPIFLHQLVAFKSFRILKEDEVQRFLSICEQLILMNRKASSVKSKVRVVGATVLGPDNNKYVAFLTHAGDHQKKLQELYRLGDLSRLPLDISKPRYRNDVMITHIVTCLGVTGETIVPRGDINMNAFNSIKRHCRNIHLCDEMDTSKLIEVLNLDG